MKRVEWRSGFETGNKEVDLQHKYFVGLINRLKAELGKTQDRAYETRLLEELAAYARFHFISEENIISQLHPHRLSHHNTLHNTLLEEVSQRVAQFQKGLVTADEIVQFVVEWFVTHTISEDVKIFL
ncbi:MAG: bacteriohemerythrin [Magnetococcales bacterium]|nr:bacteriohemerythrin [Magnetococcales bacterium]